MNYNHDRQGPNEPAALPEGHRDRVEVRPSICQAFCIGQPVKLRAEVPEYPVVHDALIGVPLWVMCVAWREDGLDYMVTTAWPPADFADRRCKADELIARDPEKGA